MLVVVRLVAPPICKYVEIDKHSRRYIWLPYAWVIYAVIHATDLCNKVNFEDACFCYSTDFFLVHIHIFFENMYIFLNHSDLILV